MFTLEAYIAVQRKMRKPLSLLVMQQLTGASPADISKTLQAFQWDYFTTGIVGEVSPLEYRRQQINASKRRLRAERQMQQAA